jgi:hypothetical protein
MTLRRAALMRSCQPGTVLLEEGENVCVDPDRNRFPARRDGRAAPVPAGRPSLSDVNSASAASRGFSGLRAIVFSFNPFPTFTSAPAGGSASTCCKPSPDRQSPTGSSPIGRAVGSSARFARNCAHSAGASRRRRSRPRSKAQRAAFNADRYPIRSRAPSTAR